jgi:hypothetical protein
VFDIFAKYRPGLSMFEQKPKDASRLYAVINPIHPRPLYREFIPLKLKYSIFNVVPAHFEVEQGQYFEGDSRAINWLNKAIFVKCAVTHLVVNCVYALWDALPVLYNSAHVRYAFSICSAFALALAPLLDSGYVQNDLTAKLGVHSLAALKEILYEISPIFLLTAVLSLLVALIGVAIIKKKPRK